MVDFSKIGRGLQGLGAGIQGKLPQFQAGLAAQKRETRELERERKVAMAKDAAGALDLYNAGDLQGADNFLTQRLGMIEQLGGDPQHTIDIQNRLRAGDPGVGADLETFVRRGVAGGYLSKPDVKGGLEIDKLRAEIAAMGKPDHSERLKEVRGGMRALKKTLNIEATAIVNNYGKVNRLAKLVVESGNRTAVAQLGISLVKLGDPGSIVKEEELRQAFAAKDVPAAFAELVSDGKIDSGVVDSVLVTLDPLNPKNINIPNILATADALVGAAIPNWENRFNQLSEQGTRVSEAGRDDILTKSFLSLRDNLAGISKGRSTGGGSASLGASGLPDGATATGPNGQKIKSVNGQWVAQ